MASSRNARDWSQAESYSQEVGGIGRVACSRWRRRCSDRTSLAAAKRVLVCSQPLRARHFRKALALRARSAKTVCAASSARCASPPTNRRAVEYTWLTCRRTNSANAASSRPVAYRSSSSGSGIIVHLLYVTRRMAKSHNHIFYGFGPSGLLQCFHHEAAHCFPGRTHQPRTRSLPAKASHRDCPGRRGGTARAAFGLADGRGDSHRNCPPGGSPAERAGCAAGKLHVVLSAYRFHGSSANPHPDLHGIDRGPVRHVRRDGHETH